MTIKKKIISFIILNVLCFITITSIYFNTLVCANTLTDYGTIFSTFTELVGANDDVPINVLDSLVFDALCPRDAGIIVRTTGRVNYDLTKKCIASYLNNKYSNQDKNKDNVTQSDINEFSQDFAQNITYSDESTTYNNNSRSMLNLCINEYLNETDFSYLYTYDITLYQFQFDNGVAYRDLLNRGTNRESISVKNTGYSYFTTPQVYNLGFVKGAVNTSANWVQVYPFNLSTWEPYDFEWDRYEFVENTYIKTGEDVSVNSLYLTIDETLPGSNMDFGIFSNGSIAYPVYDSFEALRLDNDGVQDYYINDTVYNNWSTSTGDYTVSTSNYNPVTYGDITNYVNSFNSEYGYNPNPSDIDYFIKNYDPSNPTPTPTPNPNNPSGGGSFVNNNNPIFNNNPNINITLFPSVSDNGINGGTVSGNGGNGSIGNIFDWIGNLGNVIANLIKNVGEMIVNALQGVVEAVTTILSGIPNILTPIIEFVFGGLPDEVQALITLGITCIIFVGIIKVLKR